MEDTTNTGEVPNNIGFADTSPVKDVIKNIAKDISVDASLWDLVDNAIDSFCVEETYSGCVVNIIWDGSSLTISDNGSGISLDVLSGQALRFGYKKTDKDSIGVYGVGLNRTIFKVGKSVEIETETLSGRYSVSLSVEQYLSDDDWMLPIIGKNAAGCFGTNIYFPSVNYEAEKYLNYGSSDYKTFKESLSERYGLFIKNGLSLKLNGEDVEPTLVEIREDIFPIYKYSFGVDKLHVKIESGQYLHHKFSGEEGYSLKNNKSYTSKYGWTVYCNNRAVLVSNKGLDVGFIGAFHNQYYGFVGSVMISGESADLPWNTTKSGVDLSNKLYKEILNKMKVAFDGWAEYTNSKKKRRHDKNNNQGLLPFPGAQTSDGSPEKEVLGSPIGSAKESEPYRDNLSSRPKHPSKIKYLFGSTKNSRLKFSIPRECRKVSAVVNEIGSLEVKEYPLSIALLLRVFIELSVDYYIGKCSLKVKKDYLNSKFKLCLDHMAEGSEFTGHELQALRSVCDSERDSFISIKYLQNTIHSTRHMLSESMLHDFWDSVEPLIIRCYK